MVIWDGNGSPLRPRCLDWEWSDSGSIYSLDDGLALSTDDNSTIMTVPTTFLERTARPAKDPAVVIEMEAFLHSSKMAEENQDCDIFSWMTIETVISAKEEDNQPLKFTLDPYELEDAIKEVCAACVATKSIQEDVSPPDLSLLQLDHMPYHEGCCPCLYMSHLASPDYQNDIRKFYAMVCTEGNADLGDEFLMSMLILSNQFRDEVLVNSTGVSFLVPGFQEDSECRRFWLCREQFITLFGLTDVKLRRLETRCKLDRRSSKERSFGWLPNLLSYKVGEKVYMVVMLDEALAD